MSTELEYDGRIIDLRHHPEVAAELHRLYQTRKRGQKLPLWCAQPHRGHVYLQMRHGALWACHDPLQGGPDCTTRIPKPESPAHRRYKDYTARAADNAGFTAVTEYSTGRGTRLDVAVNAPRRFGAEIQFSQVGIRDAKTRTTKSTRAGWPPIWLPGNKTIGDSLAGHVPVIRHNDIEIDWTTSLPRTGTVAALGLRHIIREKCTPSSRWKVCPDTGCGIYCRQWHPWLSDVATGWTLDTAIAGVGVGELAILQTQQRQVFLVIANEIQTYQELTGHDGIFRPGGLQVITPKNADQSRECTAERPPELYDTCWFCPQELLAEVSRRRGICEHHWLSLRPHKNAIQLPLRFEGCYG